jgi:Cof subfamily protein (haloacid dehalogenase superfamily)
VEEPRLIASDVDGTLLDPMARLTERTGRVVANVVASGTPFVLVSGRPPRWITPVAELASLDGYAVCANGAVVYDLGTGRVLAAQELDPVLLTDVAHALDEVLPGVRLAAERTRSPEFLTEHGYTNPWGDAERNPVSRAELLGRPAIKLLAWNAGLTSEEMATAALAVLADAVDVTYSTNRGLIELSARGVTKAFGLAEVCRRLGIDADDVVAFGDMPNDVEMLSWAGHGVAMANAHPTALEVADEITGSNGEDGVAQVLERWF